MSPLLCSLPAPPVPVHAAVPQFPHRDGSSAPKSALSPPSAACRSLHLRVPRRVPALCVTPCALPSPGSPANPPADARSDLAGRRCHPSGSGSYLRRRLWEGRAAFFVPGPVGRTLRSSAVPGFALAAVQRYRGGSAPSCRYTAINASQRCRRQNFPAPPAIPALHFSAGPGHGDGVGAEGWSPSQARGTPSIAEQHQKREAVCSAVGRQPHGSPSG